MISNPPLVTGSVPSVTASGSGSGRIVPAGVSTPPQTPRSTTSSVAGTKRDAAGASESEDNCGEGSKSKRRRIAPTVVQRGA